MGRWLGARGRSEARGIRWVNTLIFLGHLKIGTQLEKHFSGLCSDLPGRSALRALKATVPQKARSRVTAERGTSSERWGQRPTGHGEAGPGREGRLLPAVNRGGTRRGGGGGGLPAVKVLQPEVFPRARMSHGPQQEGQSAP